MPVTRTVTSATPHEKDGNVVRWDVEIKYEDGEEDTYFTHSFNNSVASIDPNGVEVFEEKAKEEWTLAEITALVPMDHWGRVFSSQYKSIITNPPVVPVSDNAFELPTA
jgi:hypothetical protein